MRWRRGNRENLYDIRPFGNCGDHRRWERYRACCKVWTPVLRFFLSSPWGLWPSPHAQRSKGQKADSHVAMFVSLSNPPVDVALLTGYTNRPGTESSKQQQWNTERIESLTNTYTNTHKQQWEIKYGFTNLEPWRILDSLFTKNNTSHQWKLRRTIIQTRPKLSKQPLLTARGPYEVNVHVNRKWGCVIAHCQTRTGRIRVEGAR